MSSQREQFSSRLGFLLIAAGCAIGLGNVWRFPYITGQYGGAIFVIMYLVRCYEVLEKPGTKWHLNKFWQIPGSYILTSFYGVITGWLLFYCIAFVMGYFEPGTTQEIAVEKFNGLLADPYIMYVCMITVVAVSFAIVALGVVKGVERITKPMMILLFALLFFMAARSFTLPGFAEGISYYLNPSWDNMKTEGFLVAVWAALGQVFFTLSIGQGSIEIFGTYMSKDHSLPKESIFICVLDTTVALLSGFIIFPACFSYGIEPGQGPSLLFITLTTVFSNMDGGWFWGSLFFLFMLFAALSTLIAVFESVVSICMDLFGLSRLKSVAYNLIFLALLSTPCILGFNYWSDFHPLGGNSTILDLQDFLVSNNILPLGSIVFVLFIVAKTGMGFKRYQEECNIGNGPKLPNWMEWYLKLVLPPVVLVILLVGYYNIFLA